MRSKILLMKNTSIALLFCAFFCSLSATFAQKNKSDDQEAAIKTTIRRFFDGFEKGDTTLLKSACAPEMILQTFMANKEGQMELYTESFSDLLNMVDGPHEDKYEERIHIEGINAEKSIASVWAPYTFFINGKRSHCGTDSFQLIKMSDGWKIQYILDTRRKQGCQ